MAIKAFLHRIWIKLTAFEKDTSREFGTNEEQEPLLNSTPRNSSGQDTPRNSSGQDAMKLFFNEAGLSSGKWYTFNDHGIKGLTDLLKAKKTLNDEGSKLDTDSNTTLAGLASGLFIQFNIYRQVIEEEAKKEDVKCKEWVWVVVLMLLFFGLTAVLCTLAYRRITNIMAEYNVNERTKAILVSEMRDELKRMEVPLIEILQPADDDQHMKCKTAFKLCVDFKGVPRKGLSTLYHTSVVLLGSVLIGYILFKGVIGTISFC